MVVQKLGCSRSAPCTREVESKGRTAIIFLELGVRGEDKIQAEACVSKVVVDTVMGETVPSVCEGSFAQARCAAVGPSPPEAVVYCNGRTAFSCWTSEDDARKRAIPLPSPTHSHPNFTGNRTNQVLLRRIRITLSAFTPGSVTPRAKRTREGKVRTEIRTLR